MKHMVSHCNIRVRLFEHEQFTNEERNNLGEIVFSDCGLIGSNKGNPYVLIHMFFFEMGFSSWHSVTQRIHIETQYLTLTISVTLGCRLQLAVGSVELIE